ncbi:MAG: hypothetical protein JWN76_1050 [Chitinophagaceae bacterium]|nr:hypothetical protein [Chitinophagaceae bacterium]
MPGFAAAVILYYPDEHMIENIRSYAAFVSKLYVYDNSENPGDLVKDRILQIPGVSYFHDGVNKGIAKRLNDACMSAIKDGFDWLLTMDQDSAFEMNNIKNYFNCINQYENSARVAMFGVQFENKSEENTTCKPLSIQELITSGSCVNLIHFKTIGNFDEDLFIDMVDIEYCYRAVLKQLALIQFQNIYLQHSLGKRSFHRSLKNLNITSRTLHSPVRMYYITRNFLYVSRKYRKEFPARIKTNRQDLFIRIKNNLLYNKERWQVILHIIKAINHARKNRMGKLN